MLDSLGDMKRKVLPRWRSFANTPSRELVGHRSESSSGINGTLEVKKATASWLESPCVESASELLSVATLFGPSEEATHAAKYVIESGKAVDEVDRLAKFVLGGVSSDQETLSEGAHDKVKWREWIKFLKGRIRNYQRNPILHVDLARAYASLGQSEKSEKHLARALILAPENRFVIRSAVRFFIHQDDTTRACKMVDKSNMGDPWIAATSISVHSLAKRGQVSVRKMRRLLDADFSPGQTTELSAAMATLELESGKLRAARKLFRLSGIDPNDNSVAQIYWARATGDVVFSAEEMALNTLLEIVGTHEARAINDAENENWEGALEHADKWFIDEQFSTRASDFGSFIAAEYLNNAARSKKFSERALVSNPGDFGSLNNLAYAEASMNNLKDAESCIKSINRNGLTPRNTIVLSATEGFIAYRKGNFILGSELYEKALSKTIEEKMFTIGQIVLAHWLREDIISKAPLSAELMKKIEKMFSSEKHTTKHARLAYKYILQPHLKNANLTKETSGLGIDRVFPDSVK